MFKMFLKSGVFFLLSTSAFMAICNADVQSAPADSKKSAWEIKEENKSADSYVVRMLTQSFLDDIAYREIRDVNTFIDVYAQRWPLSERNRLKTMLKGVHGLPRMERVGKVLSIAFPNFSVEADISDVARQSVRIDGEKFNIDLNRPLSSQVVNFTQHMRLKNPAKYGLLDEHENSATASANLLPDEEARVAQALPIVEKAAAVGASVVSKTVVGERVVGAAKASAKWFAPVAAGALVGTSSSPSIAKLCKWYWGENRVHEVSADSYCYPWAKDVIGRAAANGPSTDSLALTMTTDTTAVFEMYPTMCLARNNRQFRAFVKNKDQDTWSYFVVNWGLSDDGKISKILNFSQYKPELRPYYPEKQIGGFPVADRSRTEANTTPVATCKDIDPQNNMTCEMENPAFERLHATSPSAAFARTTVMSREITNSAACSNTAPKNAPAPAPVAPPVPVRARGFTGAQRPLRDQEKATAAAASEAVGGAECAVTPEAREVMLNFRKMPIEFRDIATGCKVGQENEQNGAAARGAAPQTPLAALVAAAPTGKVSDDPNALVAPKPVSEVHVNTGVPMPAIAPPPPAGVIPAVR